ncbi:hypothetical protein NHQ30_005134 [Ciborinia camelliae]|nr:hypothetical protein NHQ30_005134 [Ciborinia camelliae]
MPPKTEIKVPRKVIPQKHYPKGPPTFQSDARRASAPSGCWPKFYLTSNPYLQWEAEFGLEVPQPEDEREYPLYPHHRDPSVSLRYCSRERMWKPRGEFPRRRGEGGGCVNSCTKCRLHAQMQRLKAKALKEARESKGEMGAAVQTEVKGQLANNKELLKLEREAARLRKELSKYQQTEEVAQQVQQSTRERLDDVLQQISRLQAEEDDDEEEEEEEEGEDEEEEGEDEEEKLEVEHNNVMVLPSIENYYRRSSSGAPRRSQRLADINMGVATMNDPDGDSIMSDDFIPRDITPAAASVGNAYLPRPADAYQGDHYLTGTLTPRPVYGTNTHATNGFLSHNNDVSPPTSQTSQASYHAAGAEIAEHHAEQPPYQPFTSRADQAMHDEYTSQNPYRVQSQHRSQNHSQNYAYPLVYQPQYGNLAHVPDIPAAHFAAHPATYRGPGFGAEYQYQYGYQHQYQYPYGYQDQYQYPHGYRHESEIPRPTVSPITPRPSVHPSTSASVTISRDPSADTSTGIAFDSDADATIDDPLFLGHAVPSGQEEIHPQSISSITPTRTLRGFAVPAHTTYMDGLNMNGNMVGMNGNGGGRETSRDSEATEDYPEFLRRLLKN